MFACAHSEHSSLHSEFQNVRLFLEVAADLALLPVVLFGCSVVQALLFLSLYVLRGKDQSQLCASQGRCDPPSRTTLNGSSFCSDVLTPNLEIFQGGNPDIAQGFMQPEMVPQDG
jgi:hypothetical protein